jgi:hypothetical protein
MRPAYIGFALAWILLTFVTSFRLLVNAPGIFLVFLIIPVILIAYGLLADEPRAEMGTDTGARKPGLPGSGMPVPAEARDGAPDQPSPPPSAAGKDPGLPASREAFAYAKGAVSGKWEQWALLILATVLFLVPLSGYLMKVLRGEDPAPEARDWKKLVTDGISALLIALICLLPSILVLLGISSVLNAMVYTAGSHIDSPSAVILIALGMPVFLVLLITALIYIPVALIRFARTGTMAEAFRFAALTASIRKIGWLSYAGALIIVASVNVICFILFMIPFLGLVISIVFFPPAAIFQARFLCLVYDRTGRR